jgi:O-antigen/teichoic acid export membrane protein
VQATLATSLAIGLGAAAVAWIAAGGEMTSSLAAFVAGVAALPFLALGKVGQGGLMGLHHIISGQLPDYVLRPAVLVALVGIAALAGIVMDAPLAAGLYTVSVAVAAVAALALLYVRLPREMRAAVPAYRDREWARAAIALGLISGAAILNSQVGVTLLGIMSTPDSAGLYAVAQRGALLVAFPLSAVSVAIAPTAARLWSMGERQRLQGLVTLGAWGALLAAIPLVICYLVFGRTILEVLFGVGFVGAYEPLAILSIGQLVNAATGSVATLLVMTGHQREAAIGIGAGTIINLGAALALIPTLGTSGAALAAAIALTVSNIGLVVVSLRRLRLNPTALNFLNVRSSSA